MSPPPAHSVSPKGDDEVVSQKTVPNRGASGDHRGGAPGRFLNCPGSMGEKAPTETGSGGQVPFGPQSDTIPQTYTAPESSERPSPKGGGEPTVVMTSVQPEASDNLLEVLHGAAIDEEHRTIMSAVVEKVRSAKSGLTEAYASLLTGFEVSNRIMRKYHSIDNNP